MGIRIGIGSVLIGGSADPFTSAQYKAVYGRFPTVPPLDVALAQDTLIKTLVDGGVFAKLDGLYVINKTEAQTQLNYVKNAHNLIKSATPIFNELMNINGKSSNDSYYNADYKPKSQGVNWTNAAAHIGAYVNTFIEEDHTFIFGESNNGTLTVPANGIINRYGSWQGKLNTGANQIVEFYTTGRNAGHVVFCRDAGNLLSYFNAWYQTTAANTQGTDTPDTANWVFRNANTGLNKSDSGIAILHFGGLLTAADILLMYNAFDAYLTYIGAAEPFKRTKLVDLDFNVNTRIGRGEWQTAGGTPNYNYTLAPIEGAASILVPLNASCKLWHPTCNAATSNRFAIRLADATPASAAQYVFLRNGASTSLAFLQINTDGKITLSSGGKTNKGATVLQDNTVYYVWMDYHKGTGANSAAELYLNTVNTKPVTPECYVTAGNATLDQNNIMLYGGNEMVFDNLLIKPL